MIFCDTSTLAKYYVRETESEAVRARLDAEDQVLLSELARAELVAVFHRQWRERRWSRAEFSAVVRQFSTDEAMGYWTWVALEGAVVEQVVRVYTTLPDEVFLRTADCLHLVTALRQGFTEIHTHDGHQQKGAAALGLAVVTID
jgi:predicted nucleic acid-binding protein